MARFTRCLSLYLGCCLLLCLAGGEAIGSDNEIALSKTQPVVIKIPRKLLKYENYSRGGVPIFTANVSVVGETVIVEGESDWTSRGFPPLLTLVFEKSSKEKEYTEIEFRSNLAYIKLRFAAATPPNVDAALRQLVFLGNAELFESSAEFKALAAKLLPIKFSGVLAEIPRDKQLQLIKYLSYNDDEISVAELQGKQYIAFSPASLTAEFNSRDIKQPARVATVLKEIVLPAFDKIAPVITDANGIYGIKIRARIFSRDLPARRNQKPTVEVLDIFAPYDLVEKFFNSEITNQKLVDGSTVLVNGERVGVDLSKAAPSAPKAN